MLVLVVLKLAFSTIGFDNYSDEALVEACICCDILFYSWLPLAYEILPIKSCCDLGFQILWLCFLTVPLVIMLVFLEKDELVFFLRGLTRSWISHLPGLSSQENFGSLQQLRQRFAQSAATEANSGSRQLSSTAVLKILWLSEALGEWLMFLLK